MSDPWVWRLESADGAPLRRASDALDALLAERGLSDASRFAARMISEEVVLNAFEHGKARTVVMELNPERRLSFVDDGSPFDPTAGPPSLSDARDADEVRLRIRGLQLVHRFALNLEYRRQDDRNHLTVVLPE